MDSAGGHTSILSYSYHFQDADTSLLFRYDNAAHKPPLSFVEHKHIGKDKIISALRPPINEVIMEVMVSSGWI